MKTAWTLALVLPAGTGFAQSLEFQRDVGQKRAVSVADAVMMFYGVVNEPDPELTADKAFADLVSKNVVPESWKEEAEKEVTLGQISHMICQILDIGGGLMMRATFRSSRYCYKECARLRLVKPGGPMSRVPGRDMIALAGRIEDRLAQKQSGGD
jgi:hypothetical protein